jgi:hypothetical protein
MLIFADVQKGDIIFYLGSSDSLIPIQETKKYGV